MPSRFPAEVRRQVVELARSGTRVAQLAETFGMTQASIYSWLKQDRIDRGEAPGLSTEGQSTPGRAARYESEPNRGLGIATNQGRNSPLATARCAFLVAQGGTI